MSQTASHQEPTIPEFNQVLGHPKPLWMLFMAEFWERFAFYGIRWAMVLYIVHQFYNGEATGQKPASELYGAYLALVYASAIFGGYVADKIIGYQRSILLGAVIMSSGLFMLSIPNKLIFDLGLATIIVGNGLFKPVISTVVGRLYAPSDERRDSGFTIFYMGINLGAFLAPFVTQYLAKKVFGAEIPDYKVVFIAAGVGMILSFIWFFVGKGQLKGIGLPPVANANRNTLLVFLGALASIPAFYFLLTINANALAAVLGLGLIVPAVMLLIEGIKIGPEARDKVIAMLIILGFNVFFWCFFEQAGSSFNFLADQIVNRNIGMEDLIETLSGERAFPVAWFQMVNSIAIIALAPVLAWVWIKMGSANPTIPRKFSFGIIFNGFAFLLLMVALKGMIDVDGKIPFWTLFAAYWIQSLGELCLSPVGLSMTTKLAPPRLTGFAMGAWFLSVANGNNLAGIFAGHASGSGGMTAASAYSAYESGFYILLGSGLVLFFAAPLVQKLMHGTK